MRSTPEEVIVALTGRKIWVDSNNQGYHSHYVLIP
jgi:hypothetical protein